MSEKINVNFRAEAAKVAELDAIAKAQDRDRSYIINQALETYLAQKRWLHEQIRESIRQADAGNTMSEEEFAKIRRTWFADDSLE